MRVRLTPPRAAARHTPPGPRHARRSAAGLGDRLRARVRDRIRVRVRVRVRARIRVRVRVRVVRRVVVW